jgi:signal transduction histidine kinase
VQGRHPDADDPPRAPGRSSRLALYNWRVPTRLMVILFIPVVTGLVFAGLRVANSVDFAQQATEAERVATLARSATSLADALQTERDVSALPLTRGRRHDPAVRRARADTDRMLKRFDADAARVGKNERVQARVKTARSNLASLPTLRANAYRRDMMPLATVQAYSELFRPLASFDNELGFGSTKVTSRGRAVYAVSLAKASASTQRALVQTALARGTMTKADPVAIQASATLETTAADEFLSDGLPQDTALYNRTVTGPALNRAADDLARVLDVPPGRPLSRSGVTPAQWLRDSSVQIQLMRQVELAITDHIVDDARKIRDDAERDAVVNGAAAVLSLLLAGLLTFFISRSMVRGMGVLRGSAMDIAENRLPELVENLSRTVPGRVDTRVRPIPLFGRDEIGEVARAFDQVHRVAVRLASEQALLRGNVNAIFTNLSRRNQGLIERQLTLITELENNETDPQQLENLFRLDHLATRMRRNDENLLVLAGEEPGRRWTRPVPLVDVVRAAAAEVEQYERVELFGIPDTEIHGTAVNDLVHLLAELLENATTFSSPQTKVRVDSTRLPDGRVMIEIHDKGIGLTPEDFADINHKLANPPTVDISIARRMGLFVVGRLARRHGIKVQLRPSGESAGTTSLVMLPEPITHGGGAPEPTETEFEVSRIMPEAGVPGADPAAAGPSGAGFPAAGLSAAGLPGPGGPLHQGGGPGAAELVSGESRYGPAGASSGPADGPEALDPVGRSLQRQERLAALEAAHEGAQEEPGESSGGAGDAQRPVEAWEFGAAEARQAEFGRGEFGAAEFGAQAAERIVNGFGGGSFDAFAAGGPGSHAGGHAAHGGQTDHPESEYTEYTPFTEASYSEYAESPYPESPRNGTPSHDAFAPDPLVSDPSASEPFVSDQFVSDQFASGPFEPEPFDPESTMGQGLRRPVRSPYPNGSDGRRPHEGRDPSGATSFFGTAPHPAPGAPPHGGEEYPHAAPGDHAAQPSAHTGHAPGQYGDTPSHEGVGFTDSGLPRRRPRQRPSGEEPARESSEAGAQGPESAAGAADAEWRSANDDNWQRAAKVREPQAGGVTRSGLPRRVPRANLVPGAAQQTPQGGPQVSRAPDEVRGRLIQLRRGIQQGRNAGTTDTNGEGHGPDYQER